MRNAILIITLLLCSMIAKAQTAQEWRDSISTLSALIETHPKDLELKMRKAEANIMLGQWSYAMDEYTNILEIHPGHIGALYFRGYVNNKLRRYGFARKDFEEVLKMEPDHKGSLIGMVHAYVDENSLIEAYDIANRLVEVHHDDPLSYSTRAEVEEANKQLDLAIDDIDKAIAIEEVKAVKTKKRITLNDDLVIYAKQKVSLLRKKKDSKSISTCIDLLMKHGFTRKAAESILL